MNARLSGLAVFLLAGVAGSCMTSTSDACHRRNCIVGGPLYYAPPIYRPAVPATGKVLPLLPPTTTDLKPGSVVEFTATAEIDLPSSADGPYMFTLLVSGPHGIPVPAIGNSTQFVLRPGESKKDFTTKLQLKIPSGFPAMQVYAAVYAKPVLSAEPFGTLLDSQMPTYVIR